MPNSHRLIVIVSLRPFDEAAWKRLLIAYAYALYDQRRQPAPQGAKDAQAVRS